MQRPSIVSQCGMIVMLSGITIALAGCGDHSAPQSAGYYAQMRTNPTASAKGAAGFGRECDN